MDRKRFKKQVAFILEADKEKNILRQTHLSGHGRRENDAEHAWHMAMMIYLLKEYANAEFDLAKTMMMALIHDIVEIDAGDTYAYDTAGLATQAEREEKAAERIFGLLRMDALDELRVGDVQFLRPGAQLQAGRLQHGAHAAVQQDGIALLEKFTHLHRSFPSFCIRSGCAAHSARTRPDVP
mgnify:CR=1 FL=1